MPLIKRKSKKAFEHNLKAELGAGKPKDQALAIAYNVQRKNKKRHMYDGGEVLDADSTGEAGKRMLRGGKLEHAQEQDLRKEHMMTEDESDSREMEMLDSHPTKHAQEEDLRDESLESSMSDDDSLHDEDMIAGKPRRHAEEKKAASHMAVADDEDSMELDMLHKRKMAHGGMVDMDKPKSIADAIMRKRKMMADGGEVDLQSNADEDLNLEDQLSFEAARKKTYFDDSQISKQPMDSNEHGDEIDSDEHDMISSIRRKMKSKRL